MFSHIAIPVLYALLVWWVGTGIILLAIRKPRWTYRYTLVIAGVLLGIALWVIADTRHERTLTGAFAAFTAAIVVWGFVEVTFLTGLVMGPRTTPCPAGVTGWRRARYATETLIHHELALVAAGAAIAATAWQGNNQVAIATFGVLWVMRLSSKLNLFLGVRSLNDELLPEQLQHLRSYFRQAPMNALFPASVAAATAATAALFARSLAQGVSDFESQSGLLIAALLSLAILEHLFMMMPLPIAKLWGMQASRPLTVPAPTETKRSKSISIKQT